MDKSCDIIVVDEDRRVLKAIATRLYDGTIMTYDDRRTLAAKLDGVLERAITHCLTCNSYGCPSCKES